MPHIQVTFAAAIGRRPEEWQALERRDVDRRTGAAGGPLNLDNLRRREWAPAIEAAGVARPARIHDLRSTFASNALAAGIDLFELARVMGTSARMIERSYGVLIDGALEGIAARLAAFEIAQDQAEDDDAARDV